MSTQPNTHLSSTTYAVEEVIIRRPAGPKGQRRSSPEAGSAPLRFARGWRGLPRKDWRLPQGMTLRYVHGVDPKVEVYARGRTWSFDWDTAVLDILSAVTNRSGGH